MAANIYGNHYRLHRDGQFPDLAVADPLGLSDRGFTIFEDASGADQKRLTCRRERDSFAPSLEQISSKLAFEVVNLLAERRLRNIEPVGSMREVQFLGGSNKVFKMAELHGCSCSSSDPKMTDLRFMVPNIL